MGVVILLGGSLTASAQSNDVTFARELTQPISVVVPVDAVDDYCVPAADCSYGDGFVNFSFAGIENIGSGCSAGGYGDFTAMEGSAEIGQAYTATVKAEYNEQFMSMWIDFNKDEVFSNDERIVTDFEFGNVATTLDIMIPGYAETGLTRMRIGSNYAAISSPNPCATSSIYGEWEDYMIDITGTSTSYDAAAVSIDLYPFVGQGDVTPIATVKNNGGETISFSVTCEVEGTAYSSDATTPDLTPGESVTLEFDAWMTEFGTFTMSVTTNLSGDENPDNDMTSLDITVVSFVPEKSVVVEEGTGTWCGWCVRGIVFMEEMNAKYPESWIGIAVHNSDPMVNAEWNNGLGIEAFPSAKVARNENIDPEAFEAAYLAELEKVSPVTTELVGIIYDEASRELTFDVECEFTAPVSNYRFSAALVENGVTGTSSGYNQANYYSGGGAGVMGGFENLANPIPAADMIFNDVGRAIIGGFAGVEGSIPATVAAGESFSYTFTTVVDEDWNIANIKIIGMVLDATTGFVINGKKSDLLVSVNDLNANEQLVVYPNPANSTLFVDNSERGDLYIYNIGGVLVKEIQHVEGKVQVDISDLTSGMYFVKMVTDNQVLTSKVNVVK